MSELLTGTVAFLYTDIEGSTRLLRELGDDYAVVLRDQNALLVEAVEEHRGRGRYSRRFILLRLPAGEGRRGGCV